MNLFTFGNHKIYREIKSKQSSTLLVNFGELLEAETQNQAGVSGFSINPNNLMCYYKKTYITESSGHKLETEFVLPLGHNFWPTGVKNNGVWHRAYSFVTALTINFIK